MECYLPVTEENIAAAALIHSASWQESHKSFCSPEFVKKHTPLRQEAYLRGEMETGKRIWMLEADGEPVGIVSPTFRGLEMFGQTFGVIHVFSLP